MKNVLIIGANSYIGTNAAQWLSKFPDDFLIEKISVRDDSWKSKDFSNYDVVLHVAGIAHIKENKKNASLYYKVNRDLAYEVALKSKQSGVKQFIFMSSMSVYGIDNGVIDQQTIPQPKSHYGKSKLQAEEQIESLKSDLFKVAILRPPMIYGYGCPGNYQRLSKLASKIMVFPEVKNARSMIYIDHLCELVRIIMNERMQGIYHPQNTSFVNSSELVKKISRINKSKILLFKIPEIFLNFIRSSLLNKVFGTLVYDQDISCQELKYCIYDFDTTIGLAEEGVRW